MNKITVDWSFPIKRTVSDAFGNTMTVFNEADWNTACEVVSQGNVTSDSRDGSWFFVTCHRSGEGWLYQPSSEFVVDHENNQCRLRSELILWSDAEAIPLTETREGYTDDPDWDRGLAEYCAWAQYLRREGVPFQTDLPDWEEYPLAEYPFPRQRIAWPLEWATKDLKRGS